MSLKHQVKPATAIPTPASTNADKALAVLRIAIGALFLWAFLDKLFGFGYATRSGGAWVDGGSPTKGFLGHVDVGPFQSVLRAMAGSPAVDALFMLGLAGLGVAVLLGVALRISAVASRNPGRSPAAIRSRRVRRAASSSLRRPPNCRCRSATNASASGVSTSSERSTDGPDTSMLVIDPSWRLSLGASNRPVWRLPGRHGGTQVRTPVGYSG